MKKLIAMLLVFPLLPATSAIYYVDAIGGLDSNSGKSMSAAKKTIQSAIDAAATGDEICVMPGAYAPISVTDKALVIIAEEGPASTIIDGGGSSVCAILGASRDNQMKGSSILRGFMLQNGYNSGEGAAARWAILEGCVIKNCTGKAIVYASDSYNCLAYGNTCTAYGIFMHGDAYNCTIVDGGGKHAAWDNCLYNCIALAGIFLGYGQPECCHNCLLSSFRSVAEGNIVGDPKFIDADNGDYRLAQGSPCVDAGNNAYARTVVDINGLKRIANGTVDIGAHEFGSVLPQTYVITFNVNGGTSAPIGIMRKEGEAYGMLPIVTRSGYSFDGWYTAMIGGTRVVADDVVVGDATLYAHWQGISHLIVFNANGGRFVSPSSYQKGLSYGELPLTIRDGFYFLGWYTEAVDGELVTKDSIVDADRTLYAHWKRCFKFEWIGGGKLDICAGTRRTDVAQGIAMDSAWGNGGARAVVSVDGVEKAESRGADEFVWSGDETKEYTLKHQVYDAQGRAVGEPYTAKIAWTSRAMVTFDGGNGEEAFSREYDKSYAYGELPSVTKTGHTFAGWYTAAEGGEKVEAGAQFDGSVSKLYAHWTVNQYGVKFDKNGGEGTAGDLMVAYGDVVPMEGVAFRKSGYRLAGWATAADGAAVYGQSGAMSNLTAEANGSVQLYAVWEPTTVDLKSFKQRYPWNGFVDVECDVGAEGRVGLMLIDEASGTNFTAKTLFCQGGSATNSALWMAEGPQKFIWDAGSDLPDGFKTSKLKAKTYFVEGEE